MALNIKNERVCELARRAAAATGRSQVSVIEEALERMLRDHEGHQEPDAAAKAELISAAARRFREELSDEQLAGMDINDLYDAETGLPR